MNKTKLLIDGDIVVYSCGFASEKREYWASETGVIEPTPLTGPWYNKRSIPKKYKGTLQYSITERVIPGDVSHSLNSVKNLLDSLSKRFDTDELWLYLTEPIKGQQPIREYIYPKYKKNRDPNFKPYYYTEIKDYIKNNYPTTIGHTIEADDLIGKRQTLDKEEDTIICSLDKDLDQIPGNHYNWRKDELYYIHEIDGHRLLGKQALQGDPADNIPGLYKQTGRQCKKKYLQQIDLLHSFEWIYRFVKDTYQSNYNLNKEYIGIEVLFDLLWIQRTGVEWRDLVS